MTMSIVLTLLVLICIPVEIIICTQINLQSFSFGSVKGKYNSKAHRRARSRNQMFTMGNHKAGVKGHAIINGEYVETNRILVQRTTPMGVAYFPYGKPKVPVFIRVERELNKKYIVFQDPYLPPGEGYLVVLKRIPLKINIMGNQQMLQAQGIVPQVPVQPQVQYDAYHMYLGNNIHGTFDRLNVRKFAYGIRTKFAGRQRARQKWLLRRRIKNRSRRRFGLANRWRGKRSTASRTGGFRNVLTITLSKIRENLNPCYITRLNITQVRLKMKQFKMKPNITARNI